MFLLKELTFPNTKLLVKDFNHVDVGTNIRIYYKLDKDWDDRDTKRSGFDFYAVHFCSCEYGVDDIFEGEFTEVECIFHGVVYWDGLRHLYMGDKITENENYLYYYKFSELKDLFAKLEELENKYCESYR